MSFLRIHKYQGGKAGGGEKGGGFDAAAPRQIILTLYTSILKLYMFGLMITTVCARACV